MSARDGTLLGVWLICGALVGAPGPLLSQESQPAEHPDELPLPPELGPMQLPRAESLRLDNGLEVLLLKDHQVPLVGGLLWIAGGTQYDPPAKLGLATLTAATMRSGGTESHSAAELDTSLAGVASTVDIHMAPLHGTATFQCLPEHLEATLATFAEILRKPRLDGKRFEAEKMRLLTEIQGRNANAELVSRREYLKLVFGHGAAWARHPELFTVQAIHRDDTVEFHARHFHPDRMRLGIWGDFDRQELEPFLRKYFGGWPPSAPPLPPSPDPPSPLPSGPSLVLVELAGSDASAFVMGHALALDRKHPDYPALSVASQILGGLDGRLRKSVRLQGGDPSDIEGGFVWGWGRPGDFRVTGQTKAATTVSTLDAIVSALGEIANSVPSEEETATAKETLSHAFAFQLDTRAELMARLLTYAQHDYPLEFMQEFRPAIARVTPEDVRGALGRWLDLKRLQVVVAGPDPGLAELGSRFGATRRLDVSIRSLPPSRPVPVSAEAGSRGSAQRAASTAGKPAQDADSRPEASEPVLFEQVLEAHGGAKRLSELRSLTWDALSSRQIEGRLYETRAQGTVLFPDFLRVDRSTPRTRTTTCVARDRGWRSSERSTAQEPLEIRELPQAFVRQTLDGLLLSTTVLLRDHRKLRAKEEKPMQVSGKDYRVLVVERSSLGSVTFFIDPTTLRIARRKAILDTEARKVVREEDLWDYREVNGVWLPFSRIVWEDGHKVEIYSVNNYRVDIDVDAKIFERPKGNSK